MRASPGAQERAGEVNPSPGDDPALSIPSHGAHAAPDGASAYVTARTTRESAIRFWQRVASGHVRLSSASDELLARLRAKGCGWIETTERVRVAHVREQRGAIQARYRERQRGLRWREEYRRNKGEQR